MGRLDGDGRLSVSVLGRVQRDRHDWLVIGPQVDAKVLGEDEPCVQSLR